MPFEEINRWQSHQSGERYQSELIAYNKNTPVSFFVHANLNDAPRPMSWMQVLLQVRSSLPYYLYYVMMARHEIRNPDRFHFEFEIPASIPTQTGNCAVIFERYSSWRRNVDFSLIELTVHKYVEDTGTLNRRHSDASES